MSYLQMGEPCGGRAGRDVEGRQVVACSFCDRGCRGSMCAPNAAIVCSAECLAKYEERREAAFRKETT